MAMATAQESPVASISGCWWITRSSAHSSIGRSLIRKTIASSKRCWTMRSARASACATSSRRTSSGRRYAESRELSQVSSSGDLPVQPQARRVGARKRLSERTGSVVAHILKDLKLSPAGREVGQRDKTVAGRDNRAAVTSLLNKAINEHLGIKSGSRKAPDAGDNEDALAVLDTLGDNVRDGLKGENDG